MKTKNTLITLFVGLMVTATVFQSCKKDDGPKDLSIVSILAGDIDLNGAVSPSNVPQNSTIIITFNTAINASSATTANVAIVQDYDGSNVPITLTVAGAVLTVTPTGNLGGGTLHRLTIGTGLLNVDNQPLAEVTRTFTTAGNFLPAGIYAHYKFEDNANDVAGTHSPTTSGIRDITYVSSKNSKLGKAADFNGTTSIIEIANGDQLIDAQNFTISFWMRTNSTGKTNGHFVLGLAGWNGIQFEVFGGYDGAKFAVQYQHATGTASEDMWFPALATDNTNGGWQGWDYARSLTVAQMEAKLKDAWVHVTFTYNATSRQGTLYYDGERMKSFDFDLWPDGDAKRGVTGLKYAGAALDKVFALGFIQGGGANRTIGDEWADPSVTANQHFKGQLDELKIYHKVLTANEILLMYNSEN